ncbi:MAG: hypothetical protein ACK40O_00970 [Allosphingosinicella sp.]
MIHRRPKRRGLVRWIFRGTRKRDVAGGFVLAAISTWFGSL